MKRIVPVLVVFMILVLLTVPAMGADLQGGYYFVADSSLGSGLKFYVPSDFANGSLTFDSSGYLFNLTASSVYLYCPDYPDYSIYAPRFSGFLYRSGTGSGYTYLDLKATNITETNLQIFEEDPGRSLGSSELLLLVAILLIVLIGCIVIVRR